jgi:lipoprotein-anchoring transpeptidase ErfK/SrfK
MLEILITIVMLAPSPPRGGIPLPLRVQVALDRAHVSPGEIDGQWGSNTRKALRAFQRRERLPVTGEADRATLAALGTDSAPTLVDYAVTAEDVAGPFAEIPDDMMEKAKLDALPYATPAEALGERFHASPRLLERLNPDVAVEEGVVLSVPNVHDLPPVGHCARVVVDGAQFAVWAEDDAGQMLAFYPASVGSEHDPLPVGRWKINGVAHDPPFLYSPDLFWDADPSHAKAKVPPGPNNPVGPVWIDLSREHYGIHGTPEPSHVGKTQSHGCIRLTNWDALELASLVRPGMAAILQNGGEARKPTAAGPRHPPRKRAHPAVLHPAAP